MSKYDDLVAELAPRKFRKYGRASEGKSVVV